MLKMLLLTGLLTTVTPDIEDFYDYSLLADAVVTADKGLTVSSCDRLFVKPFTSSVTDLLLLSPSLQLNDYGSLAGLKTVSFRGFGSAHTNIYIDGIKVNNVQAGQADLGFLPIEAISHAVVNYAQNSIDFRTERTWIYGNEKKIGGKVGMKVGSFGTFIPYVRLDYRTPKDYLISLNSSYTYSEGDFAYSDTNKRENNDIKAFKCGLDLFKDIKNGDFHSKAYVHSSERGIPGSLAWPSTDRQKDLNAFLQANLKKRFSKLYTLNLSGKISDDKLDYISEWGNSNYNLVNAQLNSVHLFKANRHLNFSLAANAALDKLHSELYDALRAEFFSAAAARYENDIIDTRAALEYSAVLEENGKIRGMLLPSLSAKVNIPKILTISALVCKTYSEPTFNDLFYPGYGNPDLKAEHGWIMDIGIDHVHILKEGKYYVTANFFYHNLTDKIISAPTSDPTIWMPSNIGKVKAKGVDLVAGIQHNFLNAFRLYLKAKYNFLDARDVPFTSRHSCVVDAKIEYETNTALGLVWQGHFDRTGSSGEALKNWNTLDINLYRFFPNRISANLSLKNILNYRYELVSDYPMPARSIILGIQYNF